MSNSEGKSRIPERMCALKLMKDYLPDWRYYQQETQKELRIKYIRGINIKTYLVYCEECDSEMYWPVLHVRSLTRKIGEPLSGYGVSEEDFVNVYSLKVLADVCDQIESDEKEFEAKYVNYKQELKCPYCGEIIPLSDSSSWYSRTPYQSYLDFTLFNRYQDLKKEEFYRDYSEEAFEGEITKRFEEMRETRTKISQEEDCNVAEQYATHRRIDFQTKNENNDKYEILSSVNVNSIKGSPENLKIFVTDILKMETSIIGLGQRLEQLYNQKKLTELSYARKADNDRKRRNRIEREIIQIREDIETYSPTKDSLGIVDPKEPEKVNYPILEKAGLFNKKKVEEKNKRMMDVYQQNLIEYDIQYREYERILAENEELFEQRKKAGKEDKIRKMESMEKEFIDLSQKTQLSSPIEMVIDKEINMAETLMQETYAQRNNFYNLDIIFSKYRNPVALASFSEYLITGRCSTLEGPTGAYNIYENEIRLDRITDQLNVVIDSLEQIKQNQFTIYNELVKMNSTLCLLDESLSEALNSIKIMEENSRITNERIGEIEKNTAVTAYYSQISAYYAKKTAENTKAVAWLLALK